MDGKTKMFAANLMAAAGKVSLGEAAENWSFSHFGNATENGHCQLCHTPIKAYVALKGENAVYLFIGEDCYEKLLQLQATGNLAPLAPLAKVRAQVKAYAKTNAINEAFLAWFLETSGVPPELKTLAGTTKTLGYPPSLEAGEALVRYYKATRLFRLERLWTYCPAAFWECQVTLDELEAKKAEIETDPKNGAAAERQRLQQQFAEQAAKTAEEWRRLGLAITAAGGKLPSWLLWRWRRLRTSGGAETGPKEPSTFPLNGRGCCKNWPSSKGGPRDFPVGKLSKTPWKQLGLLQVFSQKRGKPPII